MMRAHLNSPCQSSVAMSRFSVCYPHLFITAANRHSSRFLEKEITRLAQAQLWLQLSAQLTAAPTQIPVPAPAQLQIPQLQAHPSVNERVQPSQRKPQLGNQLPNQRNPQLSVPLSFSSASEQQRASTRATRFRFFFGGALLRGRSKGVPFPSPVTTMRACFRADQNWQASPAEFVERAELGPGMPKRFGTASCW